MKQILFLTKNIYMDAEWQEKFQSLGFEVFCSKQILEDALSKQDFTFFNFFKTVVFSENIANAEITSLLEAPQARRSKVFRIEEDLASQELLAEVTEKPTLVYLSITMSLTELREALTVAETQDVLDFSSFAIGAEEYPKKISIQLFSALLSGMSKKEKELFKILYEHHGEYVSRVELSETLWQRAASNSTLTQLSQIVGRVKKKLEKIGISGNLIETNWNKGYALKNSLCESIDACIDETTIQELLMIY
ncbi:winged helix-turn-helix domain-containing protein [Enterococcus sp. LJL120]